MKSNTEAAQQVVKELRRQLSWAAVNLKVISRAEAAGDPVLTSRDSAALLVRLHRLNDRAEALVTDLETVAGQVPEPHVADGAATARDR